MSQNPSEPADQTLWETVQSLHAIVEASPVAIIALDGEGRVKMWNHSAERIFGWAENEVIGHPNPTIPPGREEEFRSLVQSRMQGAIQAGFETTRLRKDGLLIEASIWSAPLRDSAGNITGIMTELVDITARKRAENERVQLLGREQASRAEAGIENDIENCWKPPLTPFSKSTVRVVLFWSMFRPRNCLVVPALNCLANLSISDTRAVSGSAPRPSHRLLRPSGDEAHGPASICMRSAPMAPNSRRCDTQPI
jgi:PAS domain S-box-containing protein